MGPLEGLRALEIGDAGEVAGKLLADAGVDVIRVEPPAGACSRHSGPFVDDVPNPDRSLHFHYRNTSKRGVTLDLDQPQGRELWRRLVPGVDIVIDSLGPTTLDGLDAGYDACELHERLIWCSITPFGRFGPYRDWVVNDLVSMALGGPPMSCGYDDHSLPPIRSDGEQSFNMAGEYAVSGILAAVLQRERTGLGQMLDVSIHEAVSCTTEGAFTNWEYQQALVQRQTGRHSSVTPTPQTQYLCIDGDYVLLLGGGIPRSRVSWEPFLAWMDEHDAAGDLHDPRWEEIVYADPRTHVEERRHVAATVGAFAQRLTSEEVYRRAQGMHMPWGVVRRPEDNLDDPHWDDRGFFVDGEVNGHPEPVRYPRAPYRFTKSPVGPRSRAPLLGEHNTDVYGELGLAAADLAKLAKAGAI